MRMSYFLTNAVGRDQQGGFGTDLRSEAINGGQPGTVQIGDEFFVLVEVLAETTTFWLRQIGFNSSSLSIVSESDVSVVGREVVNRGTSIYKLGMRCEVTGTGTGFLSLNMADSMNTDAQNYNTTLSWDESVDPNITIRGATPEVEDVTFTDNGNGTFNADALFWDPNNQGETGEIFVNLGDKGCERTYTEVLSSANSLGYRTAQTNFPNLSSTCNQDYRVNLKDSGGNILDSEIGTFTL